MCISTYIFVYPYESLHDAAGFKVCVCVCVLVYVFVCVCVYVYIYSCTVREPL